MDKNRKEMIQKRLSLSKEEFELLNNQIRQKIESLPDFIQSQNIGIYMSYRNEADTINIIKNNKKNYFIPKCFGNDMKFFPLKSLDEVEKGTFGVLEPTNTNEIEINDLDLIIVPLLLFDKNRNRVGYGKGYYDRVLKDYHGKKIGIAFSFQEVENTYPHLLDIPLDMIITNEKIM